MKIPFIAGILILASVIAVPAFATARQDGANVRIEVKKGECPSANLAEKPDLLNVECSEKRGSGNKEEESIKVAADDKRRPATPPAPAGPATPSGPKPKPIDGIPVF